MCIIFFFSSRRRHTIWNCYWSSDVCSSDLAKGVTTVERIPAGHKVATRAIATGEPIRRYGQIIGFATSPIAPGQHVHTQNCGMGDFAKDYAFGVDVTPTPNFDLPATFDGIRRPDGRVATRNYIGILTSVNCSRSEEHTSELQSQFHLVCRLLL